MSVLLIKMECLAGTTIDECAKEMLKMKEKLGCDVEVKFNGVLLTTIGKTNYSEIVEDYYEELEALKELRRGWDE
ncbi:MAG TPA: hypothetical protein ENF81_05845 [Thermotogaceae bacterium]|nr:hypothetical protein [Thermotogaceae bacterium]